MNVTTSVREPITPTISNRTINYEWIKLTGTV